MMSPDDFTLTRRRLLEASAAAAAGVALDSAVFAPSAGAVGRPAIFYSPHQDDEAIGMAGSIMELKAAGRPVYLVLVTRGENRELAAIMNEGTCARLRGRCPAPRHYHHLGWNPADDATLVRCRTAEFHASAQALGVDQVIRFDLPDSAPGEPPAYDQLVRDIVAQIRALAQKYPAASHRFAAGWLDGNATHKACSDAAHALRDEISDLRFHHIYTYNQYDRRHRDRGAESVLHIPPRHMAAKRRSILAYKTWNPAENLYALGYHSVPRFLDEAYADPREFIYRLPVDYKPGRPW
ncbi:PIG-L deacetylase family protein [Streptomyces sp. KR80]|uniref:PIG-L deacetylase family protein n=1 Tax=Streptomyces sp. KR80 TaxID=3457426 RepID=UPI003FCFF18B